MIHLEKKFRFEAAHRLSKDYPNKCKHIHGHSWNGKIVVEYAWNKLDKYDMAVDYADLKAIINPAIELLDHSLLLWENDEFVELLKDKTDIQKFDGNPTSEVIARALYFNFANGIVERGLNCVLVSVEIEETCTTKCIYMEG